MLPLYFFCKFIDKLTFDNKQTLPYDLFTPSHHWKPHQMPHKFECYVCIPLTSTLTSLYCVLKASQYYVMNNVGQGFNTTTENHKVTIWL
jgi:hypothetical protein